MKKILLSGFFALVFSGFVSAETEIVEIQAALSIAKCKFMEDIEGCNYIISPRNVTIELNQSRPNMWTGSWIDLKEEENQTFQGSVSITKFLDKNGIGRYNVRANVGLIPEDGRSSLVDPVGLSIQITSIDELNKLTLDGNKRLIAIADPGSTDPALIALYPILYLGPKQFSSGNF